MPTDETNAAIIHRHEAMRQSLSADGKWRPTFRGETDAWICQRFLPAVNHREAGVYLFVETWAWDCQGRLRNLVPKVFYSEESAQAQCDMLNGAGNG